MHPVTPLPYWLRLGLTAAALVVATYFILQPDAVGRAACEARHSAGTCTHILRS